MVKLIYTHEVIHYMVESLPLILVRFILFMWTIVKLGEMFNHVHYCYYGGFAILIYDNVDWIFF